MNSPRCLRFSLPVAFALLAALAVSLAQGPSANQPHNQPWMNARLSPDERADLVLKQMTLDEKIDLVHGEGMPGWGPPKPNAYLGNGGAGFVLVCHGWAFP